MTRKNIILLLILLLSGHMTDTILVPSTIGSIIVGISYMVFLIYIIYVTGTKFNYTLSIERHPKVIEISILYITTIFFVHIFLRNYSEFDNVISALLMITIFLTNMYIIPRLIKLDHFYYIISRMGAGLILISVFILPLIFIDQTIVGLFWRLNSWNMPFFDHIGHKLTSVTTNPNRLGQTLFLGFFSSLALYRSNQTRINLAFVGVNLVGLILTGYRGGIVGLCIGLLFLLIYRIGGLTISRLVVIFGGVSIIGGLFGFLQYGEIIPISLSGRLILWDASVNAIMDHPVVGYGFGSAGDFISDYTQGSRYQGNGPHNAYLRISLMLGLPAGVAYLIFIIGSILIHLSYKEIDRYLVAISCGFTALSFFEGSTIFGVTSTSILPTIIIGYLLCRKEWVSSKESSIEVDTNTDSSATL